MHYFIVGFDILVVNGVIQFLMHLAMFVGKMRPHPLEIIVVMMMILGLYILLLNAPRSPKGWRRSFTAYKFF